MGTKFPQIKPYKFWVLLKHPGAKAVNRGSKPYNRGGNRGIRNSKARWNIVVNNEVISYSVDYSAPFKNFYDASTAWGAWKFVAEQMNRDA